MIGVTKQEIEAARKSGIVDIDWYIAKYPDVKAIGMDPVEHYLSFGIKMGRRPAPNAPPLARPTPEPIARINSVAVSSTVNPLPISSTVPHDSYLAMRLEVANSGFWDENWYLAKHYFDYRSHKGNLDKSAFFSPLDHYLQIGWRKGYEPSDRLPIVVDQIKVGENKISYFLNRLRFDGYHFDRNIWFPLTDRIEAYLAQKTRRTSKKVVYTCIVEGYDNLMVPYHIADEWDYVCFTNDAELLDQKHIGVWEIRPLSDKSDDPAKANRWHKMHPHVLFPEYVESIYVDGNINIISGFIFDQIATRSLPILLPQHFIRNCVYSEIHALVRSARFNEAARQQFRACADFLSKENFPKDFGLTENNVIYRRHHERKIVQTMNQWWATFLAYPPRDQMTLAYVFWKNNLPIQDHTFPNSRIIYRDFWMVKHNSGKRLKKSPSLRPAFGDKNIAVVFSTNEYFVPYLGVAIYSLIRNRSDNYNYDIVILGHGLAESSQKKLISHADDLSNVRIRYFDMRAIFQSLPPNTFHVEGYVPVETYNKCFITQVLSGYERCLYLDSDIIIVDDVQKLHDIDMEGNAIGASVNIANVNAAYTKKVIKGRQFDDYLQNELGVVDRNRYFQAGILLLDMKAMEKMNLVEKAKQALRDVRQPVFFDQCLFNKIFYGNVKFFSTAWNHVWYMQNYSYLRTSIPTEVFYDYAHSRVSPSIIHFASKDKPHTKYGWELGEIFWKYAYESPFINDILREFDTSDNEVARARRAIGGKDWYRATPRVLIHVHLFYVDQTGLMVDMLRNVTGCDYTLYVTMNERNLEAEKQFLAVCKDANFLVVPNVGYDVYPFLHVLQQHPDSWLSLAR